MLLQASKVKYYRKLRHLTNTKKIHNPARLKNNEKESATCMANQKVYHMAFKLSMFGTHWVIIIFINSQYLLKRPR